MGTRRGRGRVEDKALGEQASAALLALLEHVVHAVDAPAGVVAVVAVKNRVEQRKSWALLGRQTRLGREGQLRDLIQALLGCVVRHPLAQTVPRPQRVHAPARPAQSCILTLNHHLACLALVTELCISRGSS